MAAATILSEVLQPVDEVTPDCIPERDRDLLQKRFKRRYADL